MLAASKLCDDHLGLRSLMLGNDEGAQDSRRLLPMVPARKLWEYLHLGPDVSALYPFTDLVVGIAQSPSLYTVFRFLHHSRFLVSIS